MIKRYRKLPVEIEAMRLNSENIREAILWINGDGVLAEFIASTVVISTLEGNMSAQLGDWIIKGVKGEFYPCKPDIFEATYEEVQ